MNSNQVLEQFYNWLQENSLSSNAIALYTILLALKQKSKNELYVRKSNEFLCSILNISENTLKKARDELKNNGLIDFEITTGRKNITKYLVLLPESCNQIEVSKKVSEFDTFVRAKVQVLIIRKIIRIQNKKYQQKGQEKYQ